MFRSDQFGDASRLHASHAWDLANSSEVSITNQIEMIRMHLFILSFYHRSIAYVNRVEFVKELKEVWASLRWLVQRMCLL